MGLIIYNIEKKVKVERK